MTRVAIILACLFAFANVGNADDKPKMVLPSIPAPAPTPGVVSRLGQDQLYVMHSDDEWVVTASPQGIVKITKETGPIRIRGRFVDGTGIETRTFAAKNVWIIEAAATARCEVLAIPAGAKTEADILRQLLDVDNGTAPWPPPGPGPDPGPGPKPPEPQPVTSFRVFLIYESADNLTPDQRGIIYGKVVADWLDANCTNGNKGWRRRDKDAPGENDPSMAPLWAAIKPKITTTPCVAIEVNGKVDILPLDASPLAMLETLKKYRGK